MKINQGEKKYGMSSSRRFKKFWIIFNAILILVVVFFLFYIIWENSLSPEVIKSTECIEVNKVASLVFDSCYDAYTKNIFLSVKRGFDNYHLNAFEFSFFDFDQKFYKISDVPSTNGSKAFKLPAEKNPQNIQMRLEILKDFSAPVCDEPRTLFVKYCPLGINDLEVNGSISPLEGVEFSEFKEVSKMEGIDSDVFSMSLVDKERIWESQCDSDWRCSSWESCEGGIQKRTCKDLKKCFIPTEAPEEVKYCGGFCEEKWACTWSECSNGYTTPDCEDLNHCGTKYQIPKKLECNTKKRCEPDLKCSPWSSCEVDYNFIDLTGGSISELQGVKSRVCKDGSGCVESKEETQVCSLGVDIYTRRIDRCGKEFVGIYDRLNNDLIARIEQGSNLIPKLNIYLGGVEDDLYCGYCSDGRLSGDEENIDCGGSCMDCSEKYPLVEFRKKSLWTRFWDWVKRMLI